MDKIGTRVRNNYYSAELRKPDTRTYSQNSGLTYTASTITFTNPNQINDSANGLGNFTAGMRINVKGSDTNSGSLPINDGDYLIVSATSSQILTREQTITTDSNAQTVTIFPS